MALWPNVGVLARRKAETRRSCGPRGGKSPAVQAAERQLRATPITHLLPCRHRLKPPQWGSSAAAAAAKEVKVMVQRQRESIRQCV